MKVGETIVGIVILSVTALAVGTAFSYGMGKGSGWSGSKSKGAEPSDEKKTNASGKNGGIKLVMTGGGFYG